MIIEIALDELIQLAGAAQTQRNGGCAVMYMTRGTQGERATIMVTHNRKKPTTPKAGGAGEPAKAAKGD